MENGPFTGELPAALARNAHISMRSCVIRTVTIRLIRSFEHRNIRFLVLKSVHPDTTVSDLMSRIDEGTILHIFTMFFGRVCSCLSSVIKSYNLPPPFKKYKYGQ